VSDERAAIEEAAALLRAAGWEVKPPPPAPLDKPRIGLRVRYIRDKEHGPDAGDTGTIIDMRDDGSVFWVRPDNWLSAQIWTTSSDVEAV
jgi:hypothetical protein